MQYFICLILKIDTIQDSPKAIRPSGFFSATQPFYSLKGGIPRFNVFIPIVKYPLFQHSN